MFSNSYALCSIIPNICLKMGMTYIPNGRTTKTHYSNSKTSCCIPSKVSISKARAAPLIFSHFLWVVSVSVSVSVEFHCILIIFKSLLLTRKKNKLKTTYKLARVIDRSECHRNEHSFVFPSLNCINNDEMTFMVFSNVYIRFLLGLTIK